MAQSFVGLLVLATGLLAGQARAQNNACAPTPLFAHGTAVLPVIKVFTGADGVSHIGRTEIKGFAIPFFNSSGVLTQTVLGPSLKVVLVQGPANAQIPVRAGIGRVMFLILQGSSTVVLPNGEEATASPGEVIIFDDASSKTGHGGRIGPCGYTSLSIAIPDDAPDVAVQR
jgi:quercetin dioxygenase-like cupin family protein